MIPHETCDVCGISAVQHTHPPNTLPKDFVRTEPEAEPLPLEPSPLFGNKDLSPEQLNQLCQIFLQLGDIRGTLREMLFPHKPE